MVLLLNNIDIAISYDLNHVINYSIGPTFSFISRSYVIDDVWSSSESKKDLNNRLVSLCAGINFSVNFEFPFNVTNNNGLFFFTKLKMRYLHAFWFDARGRNLDNYYQDFFFSQIHLGIGYSY
jgi:hypothetical protein